LQTAVGAKAITQRPTSTGTLCACALLSFALAQADFDQCLKLKPAMKESLKQRIEYARYQRDKKKR